MSALWTVAPARTPRQLIAVRAPSVPTATAVSPARNPVSSSTYRAKVTDTAAMPPLWVTSSSPQPYTNAAAGWNASRK